MNELYRYSCIRCDLNWASKQDRPRVCPKCKTPYWDVEKVTRFEAKPIKLLTDEEMETIFKAKIQKNKWGRWKYNHGTHCLEVVKLLGGHKFRYEVDLNRYNTGAKLLDWIYQVQGKNWISPDDVADLVYSLDDIVNVQSELCSGGENLKFDFNKYLSERVDPIFK
ncbi:hypothetical protein ACFLYL_04460 [Chloroflexota bacterium]